MRPSGLCMALIVLVAPVFVRAQETAWGDPDLQGVWTNQTPVPLERPEALAAAETQYVGPQPDRSCRKPRRHTNDRS
jgi:hypothetical protein